MSGKLLIILFSVTVLLLSLAVIYLSLRIQEIKHRIHGLLDIAEKIANKVIDKKQQLLTKSDFRNLFNKFSGTLKKIEKQSEDLESRISVRTSEIETQNRQLIARQKEAEHQNLELKSAYEALLESRRRYEQLIENLKGEYIFFSQSPAGELLFVSLSVKDILGYEINEYRRSFDKIYTDNPINEKARNFKNGSLKGVQQPKYLVEWADKEGKPHIFEITEFPVFNENNEFISVEGIARDITKGIIAEDLIQEKEEKYKLLFNKASDFIFFYNLEENAIPGKFLEVNDYTVNRLGYSKEELLSMSLNDLTDVELWDKEDELYDDDGNKKYEQIWTTKEGDLINVEIISHNFMIKNKRIGIAIARDITERKQVEEEIRYFNEELVNQKENLEALVDNLTQTQEQLVHSEKMAALGQLIAGVAHEINTPLGAIKASIGNLHDSLDKAITGLPALLENQTTDSLKLFVKVLRISSDEPESLTTREKRKIRKELAVKLEDNTIKDSEVIADLLIYFNVNADIDELLPLLAMPGAVEILQSARNFVSIVKNSRTITVAADKAAKVVFALKKYAHRDIIEEKIPTDIVDGLETVLTLYHNQLKHGVEVIRNYDTLPAIGGYPDDLNQVWTNLIHNSIQAMEQHGKLTITTRNHGDFITVSITDTGCGIEPDIQDKIFEPFFTTKKQGEGSGLGRL